MIMYIHTVMNDWEEFFDIREGSYVIDFRLCNPIDNSKGDTYIDTERAWCNLMQHDSIYDIYDTLNHEAKHIALKREDLNDDVEHLILRKISWAENDWV